MNIPFVDLKGQYRSIKNEIDAAIQDVIDNTAFIGGSGNKFVVGFENNFARYVGTKQCVGCANGTDSLEIILRACGIGFKDEVIVPALTWISTSEAVSSVGATPIFADIMPDTYTINPDDIAKKITSRTKAIIPVHLYGMPAEMDAISKIADQHGLLIIEDCAQAHGAEYKDRKVGLFGKAGSFSFFPGKNLGAYGDAGGLVTDDENLATQARMIANHGQLKKHEHLIEGRNSRLDGLQAAILKTKLPYLDRWTNRRIENAALYEKYLDRSKIKLPSKPKYVKHVYHVYAIQSENREALQERLKWNGIESSVHYPTPLPLLRAYEKYGHKPSDFPVAVDTCAKILSLPMFAELTEEQIILISQIINE